MQGEGKEEVPPEFVGDEEACALIGSSSSQYFRPVRVFARLSDLVKLCEV